MFAVQPADHSVLKNFYGDEINEKHTFEPLRPGDAVMAVGRFVDFWRTRPQNQLAPKTNSPSKGLIAFVK